MMQMEKERRNGNYNQFGLDNYDGMSSSSDIFPNSSSLPLSSPPSSSGGGGGDNGVAKCIEHRVSKMDTLAGVAIKYGVEVADIKRMNGLVTDLQMFALKTLQIPLPGRHPPSPYLSNGADTTGQSNNDRSPSHHVHCDLFESFQTLRVNSQPVSPAMSSLQGYYGLKPTNQKTSSEGLEMGIYPKEGSHYLEDGPFRRHSVGPNRPLSLHRKSRSLVNGFLKENGELDDDLLITGATEGDSNKGNEKLVRRRQKSEADFSFHTPEMLLKDDNSSSGGFSARTGKGLALRPKSASRTALAADAEAGLLNPIPIGLGDSIVADSLSGVRKSSSTSSLQEQDNSSSSSIWSTSKWSLMQDLQALSAAASTRPIFDGLPKPITSRRNKTAVD